MPVTSLPKREPEEEKVVREYLQGGLRFDAAGDTMTFLWQDQQLEVLLERFYEDKLGTHCEITIDSGKPEHPKPLHAPSTFNLTSERGRTMLVNKLMSRRTGHEWAHVIEIVATMALNQYRNGNPIINLNKVDYKNVPPMILYPYVGGSGGSIIFADGGTGKSVFALLMAMSVATGRPFAGMPMVAPTGVLYLDWEDDEYAHSARLHALSRGLGLDDVPEIYYRHMTASLNASIGGIRRLIFQLGVGMVVVDSLAAACGGGIEDSEAVVRCFDAARLFGVPWIGITHVTNEGAEEQASGTTKFARPYGSRFTFNLARVVWGIQAVQNEGDPNRILLLTNVKNNNGPLAPQESYRINYDNTGGRAEVITIERTRPQDVPELFSRLSLSERIMLSLKGTSTDAHSLAEGIGENHAKVVSKLDDLKRQGKVVKDEQGMWTLKIREEPVPQPTQDEIDFAEFEQGGLAFEGTI